MSDFNLTAAINVQLAKGAGASLAADINKHLKSNFDVTIKPKIEPKLIMSAQAKRVFPVNKGVPSEVRLKLIISNQASLDTITKDRSIKVDVEFSDASKKAIDDLGSSLAKLKKRAGELDNLTLIAKNIQAITKAGANLDLNIDPAQRKIKRAEREVADLFSKIKKLADESAAAGNDAGFFNRAFDQVKQLQDSFKQLKTDAEKITAISGSLGGISGNSAKNILTSLDLILPAITEIQNKRNKLNKKGLIDVDPHLKQNLEAAEAQILKLFGTIDSTDQFALSAQLKDIKSTLNDNISTAQKFRSVLAKVNQEIVDAQKSGASKEKIDLLRQRAELIKSTRAAGNVSPDTLNERSDFQNLAGAAKNYTQIERAASQATLAVIKLTEKSNTPFFSTEGAVLIDAKKQVKDLASNYKILVDEQKSVGAAGAAENIRAGLAKLGVETKVVEDNVKSLNGVLDNLNTKSAYYLERGMTEAAKAVDRVKENITDYIKSGKSISTTDTFFQTQNQQIEHLADNVKKIDRFIGAVDRLKASLQFSTSNYGGLGDAAGVGTTIEKLEREIKGSSSDFDERKIRNLLSDESYKIRNKDKLNKIASQSVSVFEDAALENASQSKHGKLAFDSFKGGGSQMEAFLRTLDLANDDLSVMGKNMDLIKRKRDELFTKASIDAEGGWIGAFGKSLGLAAKRLTTFLFAARAVYGIQNAMIDATGAAVELDREFIRLEQIFAGSRDRIGSVQDNVNALSSEILTLGRNYGVASTEIAKSADIFAQAGIQGKALQKVLEISTKARLGPTFGSNVEISEAVIASMKQFKIQADDMEYVIGGISQVSAQFAVESDGITKAIRRAGGAFAAAKADGQSYLGALGEFVGAFTILKQQTREADETLATSLRNILNRLQRGSVQKYLRENFKIDLLDQNGQFKGFARSIEEVSQAIQTLGIKSGDPRFAELVQKLAGSLQSSRLTSLLADAGSIKKAVEDFQNGGKTLDRDAAIAFKSIENKLLRAKNAVVELFTELARSEPLKALIELFVILTNVATSAVKEVSNLAVSFGVLGQAIGAIGAFSLGKNIVKTSAAKFLTGARGSGILGPKVGGLNNGGLVPGIGPNIDTEPYMLAKGEYVVNRHSVQKYGKGFFNDLNSGKVKHAATGSGPNGLISSVKDTSNGVKELDRVMAHFGVSIRGLSKVVKSFDIKKRLGVFGTSAKGVFNNSSKGISVDATKGLNLKTLSHEIGHAIDVGLGDISKEIKVPKELREQTLARIAKSPNLYGKNPTKTTIRKEAFADLFQKAIAYKGGDKSNIRHAKSFDSLLNTLGTKGVGVSFASQKGGVPSLFTQDNRRANSIPDFIRSQGAFKPQVQGPPKSLAQSPGILSFLNKPLFGTGGTPPKDPPKIPGFGGGGFFDKYGKSPTEAAGAAGGAGKLGNLLSKLGGWGAIIGAAVVATAAYASSSGEASEKVKNLASAVAAAAAAVGVYAFAMQAATKSVGSQAVQGIFGKLIPTKIKTGFAGIKGGSDKLFGAVGSKLTSAFPGFSSGILKLTKLIGPQALGAAIVAVTVGLNSLAKSQIEASEKIISNSTSEKEVAEERAKIDKLKSFSGGISSFGKVVGGAATGAAIGSVVPVIGTALGAIVGGLSGFAVSLATDLKNTEVGSTISNIGSWLAEWGSALADVLFNSIGAVASGIDSAFGAVLGFFGGGKDPKRVKEANSFQANLDASGANINYFNKGAKSKNGVGVSDIQALVKGAGQVAGLTTGFSTLGEDDKNKAKERGEGLKSALDSVTDLQRGTILAEAKKSNVNIVQIFKDLGITFDEAKSQAALAANKLSAMFLQMESVSKNIGGALDNLNANTETYSNLAAGIAGEGNNGAIPSSVFESLKNGNQVSGAASANLQKQFGALQRFSPVAAQNAQFEYGGATAAKQLSNKLAFGQLNLGGAKTTEDLKKSLFDSFDQATQGQSPEVKAKLDDAFGHYIESQQEALVGATAGGTIDYEKVNGVITGFSESIKRGGVDLLQKFSESNNQFKQALDGVIKRRIEYENKITDIARSNVDKERSILELKNKAAGKADTEINLSQARGFDSQKQALLLRGTGLGGGASVSDIRGRYDALNGQDPSGSNPIIQGMKENLLKALEGVASGTDSFTTAMREFDKAAEQSKKRTEELSNALLGTDENLINVVKGIQLGIKVKNSKSSTEAFLALQNSSESSRAAFNQSLSGDPDAALSFQRKLGIAPNIVAGPEAKTAEGEINKQIEANNALIGINQNLSNQMGGLANAMVQNKMSFEQFGTQINNFANSAANLAGSLTNIPQNITHNHTFRVDPIQVVITGTDGLASLDGPMQQAVVNLVNSKIASFANNLKEKNKGLTVDSLTLNSATA